jgi:hypothetical protein
MPGTLRAPALMCFIKVKVSEGSEWKPWLLIRSLCHGIPRYETTGVDNAEILLSQIQVPRAERVAVLFSIL